MLARAENFVPCPEVLNKVQNIVAQSDAHVAAIVCGGMTTSAVTARYDHQPVPLTCPECCQDQVPSVHHVLWSRP